MLRQILILVKSFKGIFEMMKDNTVITNSFITLAKSLLKRGYDADDIASLGKEALGIFRLSLQEEMHKKALEAIRRK